MSDIKPSDHGIVVENKETGLRYASLDVNYDPNTERKVRDLRAGETVLSYVTRAKGPIDGSEGSEGGEAPVPGTGTPEGTEQAAQKGSEGLADAQAGAHKGSSAPQTASSASAGAGK